MTKAEIDSAYNSLWLRFSTTCRNAKLSVKPLHSIGYNSKPDADKRVKVDALIYLKDWPYKANSKHDKSVDILVQSTETFSCDLNVMTHSTVQATYFRTKDNAATPISAIHYDFRTPVDRAHPVFHAQFGVTKFDPEKIKAVGFRKQIQEVENPHYGNLKIPTPYMNFASVLLGVAADHLPHNFFDKFLVELRSNQGILWNASCDKLRSSLVGKGGFLHSHHWYSVQ